MERAKVRHYGFSLIEMTLVMLIIGIILIAMTPVMTSYTKKTAPQLLPWQRNNTSGNNDADGIYTDYKVRIGQDSDLGDSPLVITRNSNGIASGEVNDIPVMTFVSGGYNIIGRYFIDERHNLGIGYENYDWIGNNTQSTNNIAIGLYAMNKPETVADKLFKENIAIGTKAGYENTKTQPTSGMSYAISNAQTDENIFLGSGAGADALWGVSNIYIGKDAGAGFFGRENIAIGYEAAKTSGSTDNKNNICLGDSTCTGLSGQGNIFIGHQAGMNNTLLSGDYNIGIGDWATSGGSGGLSTSISYSIGIGYRALFDVNSLDNYSTAIGYGASRGGGGKLRTCIGYRACPEDVTTETLGYRTNSSDSIVFITSDGRNNAGSILLSANNVYIGGANTFATGSDKRLKNNIKPYDISLTDYGKINTYLYTLKNEPQQGINIGILAQEVKDILKTSTNKSDDRYYVFTPDELVYATVVAIQKIDNIVRQKTEDILKQTAKIKQTEVLICKLETKKRTLVKDNQILEKEIKILNKRLSDLEKERINK